MLNIKHEIQPVPADLPSHFFGMLSGAHSGEFELRASGKEGSYVFLAVKHVPVAGQESMSGIYVVQTAKKPRGKAMVFIMHSEQTAPYEAACCPPKVLTAANWFSGNTLFRATSARYQQGKKAMRELKIGSVVLFRMGLRESTSGQQIVVARYVNRNQWERLSVTGPTITMTAEPQSLYRYAPEVVYPELLAPVVPQESFVPVAGFFYECSGGEYATVGRPFTEFELAKIRHDQLVKAQVKILERPAARARLAFV